MTNFLKNIKIRLFNQRFSRGPNLFSSVCTICRSESSATILESFDYSTFLTLPLARFSFDSKSAPRSPRENSRATKLVSTLCRITLSKNQSERFEELSPGKPKWNIEWTKKITVGNSNSRKVCCQVEICLCICIKIDSELTELPEFTAL